LRTLDEALALKAELHQDKSCWWSARCGRSPQIASSAAELGIKTTVMELAAHIWHGWRRGTSVLITSGIAVLASDSPRTARDGATAHCRGSFETTRILELPSTLISSWWASVILPRTASQSHGLIVQDGIVLDDHCRTPILRSCGRDCTRFQAARPIRLENWRPRPAARLDRSRTPRRRSGLHDAAVVLSEQYDMTFRAWAGRSPIE